MCRPHWFNHPHQIVHSSSQGFLVHSSPGERGGSETRDTGRVADSSVGRAPDKKFKWIQFWVPVWSVIISPILVHAIVQSQILFHDLSKYVYFFLEPAVYWSSGRSYQGVGHQESPDPHLWPEGSFPGCQENQGLISKK